jgi:acetolactate synthase-1/2/3 large subunit
MPNTSPTGADLLIRAALSAGVTTCFANPGTTELALVKGLDENPSMRSILCLFEGVCSGAADGFARMSSRPALTLSHLGPGFANSIANLHNARRANTPVINVIGDHTAEHLPYDAPLTSDIEALSGVVSALTLRLDSAAGIAEKFLEAYQAAIKPPGQVVTLIFPADIQEAQYLPVKQVSFIEAARPTVDDQTLSRAAEHLKKENDLVLLLGDQALSERGQRAAARIAAVTGARVIIETFIKRMDRGAGVPDLPRLPYFPDQALKALGDAHLLLVGAKPPVSFFGYPEYPSLLVPENRTNTLANAEQDCEIALESLADLIGAPAWISETALQTDAGAHGGALTTGMVGAVLAQCLPENAAVVVEGASCGYPFYAASGSAPRHSIMTTTGGAIGQGPPCATGAAVAAPNRTVVNLQSDGSALYTSQALWTQAREGLNVKTLIASNRRYGILQTELQHAGVTKMGEGMQALTTLDNPPIDWVSLAKAYGVPACKVDTGESMQAELERAFTEPGPELIELQLP